MTEKGLYIAPEVELLYFRPLERVAVDDPNGGGDFWEDFTSSNEDNDGT